MNNKKKAILAIIFHTLVAVLGLILLSILRIQFFYYNGEFSQLIFYGVVLIYYSFLTLSLALIFCKYGIIWTSPWKHAMQGGEYSWWIEEEKESDIFWRIVVLQLVFFICLLIAGIALIIIGMSLI